MLWFTRTERLLLSELRLINQRSIKIMATVAELKDAVAGLTDHITTEAGQVSEKLAELSAQIVALQDVINTGGTVTPAQLDEVVVMLNAAIAQVDAIIPDAPPVPL